MPGSFEVRVQVWVRVRYTEHKINRLGKSYDTDCYPYDLDTNFKYYRIRSDCVNDCYQDKIRKICNVDRNLFMNNILIRRDYITNRNDRFILGCDPAAVGFWKES